MVILLTINNTHNRNANKWQEFSFHSLTGKGSDIIDLWNFLPTAGAKR